MCFHFYIFSYSVVGLILLVLVTRSVSLVSYFKTSSVHVPYKVPHISSNETDLTLLVASIYRLVNSGPGSLIPGKFGLFSQTLNLSLVNLP